MAYTDETDPSTQFIAPTFAELVEDHPDVVTGQSDSDPYSNNEAKNDLSRPLHPRR